MGDALPFVGSVVGPEGGVVLVLIGPTEGGVNGEVAELFGFAFAVMEEPGKRVAFGIPAEMFGNGFL